MQDKTLTEKLKSMTPDQLYKLIIDVFGAYSDRQEWISVETRNPDEELKKYREKHPDSICVPVIVSGIYCDDSELGFYDGKFWDVTKKICINLIVTHWMPLPEPPKQ